MMLHLLVWQVLQQQQQQQQQQTTATTTGATVCLKLMSSLNSQPVSWL